MDSRVRRVYELAARAARDQTFTYYQQVADELKLEMSNPAHRNELAHLLGRVSEAEHEVGRPMLSAVVVLAGDSPVPGEGFFTLARALGHSGTRNIGAYSGRKDARPRVSRGHARDLCRIPGGTGGRAPGRPAVLASGLPPIHPGAAQVRRSPP